ncbi:sigma-70 family RNA polymerase sigma factor [Allosphingosinicella sp.]|uniref:sigma-70 family RNA polymerase sigma factor n=1 Tax=Allosphingosinicella sp. TaxID=2823234 RepID=UPI002FC0B6CA
MASDTEEPNVAALAQRAREAFERSLGAERPDPSEPPDPERLRRLEAAVRTLPRRQREIFLALRLDHMSYAQIAERTGLSIETVKRHFAAALYHLRHHMTYGRSPGLRARWRRCLRLW